MAYGILFLGLSLVDELDSIATRLEENTTAGNRLSAVPRIAMDLLARYVTL